MGALVRSCVGQVAAPAVVPSARELTPIFRLERMLDLAANTNTGTPLGDPGAYVYTTTDGALWDDRANDVHNKAALYITGGRTNLINLDSVVRHLTAIADAGYMRLNSDTVYESGTITNYAVNRSWAMIQWCWSWLKTRGSAGYTRVQRKQILDWMSDRADDIMWYYTFEVDTLGSKQNNHFYWGVAAAAMIATCTGRVDVLKWVILALQHFYDDTLPDPVINDAVQRPIVGYDPDGDNPLPARGIIMYDLDRRVSNSQHDGVYYNWYCAAAVALASLICRANGTNMLLYQGVNGDMSSILSAYKAICDDDGAAVADFLTANDAAVIAASDTVATAELQVSTHKIDRDISAFRLLTALPEFSSHAAAATINTNLASKTQNFFGGAVDSYRPYLVGV